MTEPIHTITLDDYYGQVTAHADSRAVWIHHLHTRNGDTYHSDFIGITDPVAVLRFAHELIAAAGAFVTEKSGT